MSRTKDAPQTEVVTTDSGETGVSAALPTPAKRAGRGSVRRRLGAIELSLVIVACLYAGVLLLGPLAAILWGSFAEGAVAFLTQMTSDDALSALKLTLLLAAAATILNTIFGLAVAYVLVRDYFPGREFVNALVDLPFAVSPVIAGLMVIILFGKDGWLTPAADLLGVKVVFALPGMLMATVFVSLPFVVREVMPVLAQAGVEQEQAAYTLGANSWRVFRDVTLPSIRWGLLYGVSLTFARALGEFGAVLVVSGGVSGLTETSTLFIFRSLDDRNETAAYAMAATLAAFSFVVLILMEFFKKRSTRH